jgi:carboxymethylenebutenolidase
VRAMRPFALAAVACVLAASLSGCADPASPGPTTSAAAGTATATTTGTATTGTGGGGSGALAFRAHPTLGPILVDGDGMTLYVFTNDTPGNSTCAGGCAANWPPLLATAVPDAPAEVRGQLGLAQRPDGSTQLAYRGRPLYHWAGDQAPGDARGDGLNMVWFVVREPAKNSALLNGRGSHETQAAMVDYGGQAEGYLAQPRTGEPEAGVVMVHEWWGLNANIKEMADILASHGYLVLAVDLFGGNVAETPAQALQQVQALNQTEATADLRAAAAHLRTLGAQRVASLGWCFGGGQSLQLAVSGEPLAATVVYYGNPVTDEALLARIDWPVLGIFGEADTSIPVPRVRAFQSALANASVENQVYIYPDVGHAFANPSGAAWAPNETKDAWARTLDFLGRHADP